MPKCIIVAVTLVSKYPHTPAVLFN